VIVFFLLGLVLLPLVNVPKAMAQGKQGGVPLEEVAVKAAH